MKKRKHTCQQTNTHSFLQTKHLHELCKFGYSVRQQLSIRVLQEQSQILHLGLAQCKCCTRRTGHPSAPSSVPLRLSSLPFHLNISAVSEEVHKGRNSVPPFKSTVSATHCQRDPFRVPLAHCTYSFSCLFFHSHLFQCPN